MFDKIIKTFKDVFGENNEVFDSTKFALEDRLVSPFYGYFLISWFVVNWNFVYAALFIDQDRLLEKTGLLRNEYIFSILPEAYSGLFFWRFFILPIIITALIFWVFPYGTRVFYRKNIRNKKALKIIELQESQQETREEVKLAQEEKSLLREEVERAIVEKRAEKETPEVVWEKEFKAFKKMLIFQKFEYIVKSVYEHSGDAVIRDMRYGSRPITFQIPQDILAFSHTSDLVTLDKIKGKIELTEKGKYFVAQYIQSK